MSSNLYLGEVIVEHRIDSRLRHTHLIVDHDANVILKSPKISADQAMHILEKKRAWIHKKLAEQTQKRELSFAIGQEVRYLGTLYRLTDDAMFHDLNRCLERSVKSQAKEAHSRCYDRFYRARAIEYLIKRVHYLEHQTGLRSTEVKFRKMRRRWGSCSSKGVITLNTRLMLLPEHLIDHIIIHELSHLRHMDHSRAFYEEMQRHLPDHRDHQRELRNIRLS